MTDKCKPKSTWRIYFDGLKSIRISPTTAGISAALMWIFIGVFAIMFQIPDMRIEPPLFVFSFPLNIIIVLIAVFVIVPLGFIHFFKLLEADC